MRGINPKNLLRVAAAGALALTTLPSNVQAGGGPAEIRIDVSCSDRPAYGSINMGPHAAIYLDARNLRAIPGAQPDDGMWLYIGKPYAASGDPTEARGSRVVGFNGDPNAFTAYMDGFINSIRGQDIVTDEDGNQEVRPITFNPNDEVSIALRRGPYTLGLPMDTVQIAKVVLPIPDCAPISKGELI